ncbi:MAG TPA: hypothetical protein VGD99_18170 [Anaerolineae bacterium]|jgi:ABC-type cobalamin transport system permease subunit
MQITFKQMRWLAALTMLILILLWLSGCGGSNTANPALQPAANQPTFVWIFKVP